MTSNHRPPLRQRGFASLALLSAGALLFSSTSTVLLAATEAASDGAQRLSRHPQGGFTQAPTRPFLGVRPGRDPHGRGGVWSPERRARALQANDEENAVVSMDADIPANTGAHTLSVEEAPGSSNPWEGSTASGVNTGNGNKLTTLHLTGWKARGGMALDFTLFHNSQSEYDDELGHGWTWTYDVYVNNLSGDPILHWGDGTAVPYSSGGTSGSGGAVQIGGGGTTSGPTTYTPPTGFHDSLVRETNGTWTVTKKDGTKYRLNAAGFLTSVQDTNGNLITLTLDAANYVTRITDPTGRYVDVNVDANHKFTGITDMRGRTWGFARNASDELVSVTWPSLGDGYTYTDGFAYDAGHRITTQTDRAGNAWARTYNADGSLASEADPLGHATTYAYGASATTVTDALGHATVDNYGSGRLASQVDASGFSVSYTAYDTANNVTSVTDARGKVWSKTYDAKGNVLTSTNPLGKTTSKTYSALSKPLAITDALGHTTTNTYDANGNLLTVTNALGKTVLANSYGAYGLLASSSDALGNATSFGYDGNGYRTTVTDPTGVVQSAQYDSRGMVANETDGAGNVTYHDADEWDREWRVMREGLSGFSSQDRVLYFLPTGQVGASFKGQGPWTFYDYDDAGRKTATTNGRGDVENYTYDAAGRRASVTNGRGKTRTYVFTNRGDVSGLAMPDGSLEAWGYDGAGNKTGHTNGIGDTVLYGYDDAGRQNLVDYPSGTDTTFAYDDAGRRIGMTDATGATTWAYDAADRVTTFASPQGTQTSAYDDAGHRTSLVGAGISRAWTYDDAGRSLTLTNEQGETTSNAYLSGRLASTTLANGQVTLYGYDGQNRPISIVHKASASGATISSEGYVYDDASNLTSKTANGTTTTYGYDGANQLTSESRPGYSAGYAYDANGNRTAKTLNGVTQTYAVDDGDKLLSVSENGAVVKSFGYDAAGRTTSVTTASGTTTLGYDYEGRVTSIAYPSGGTNSFAYNGMDTRVGKTDSAGTSAYRRDGASVTSDVLSDGSAVYTPGVSQRRGSTTTYDLSDLLGTATVQTNASANATATRIYDAYGMLASTTGIPQGPFGFAGGHGYQEDGDSGLKLLGHRYYDSSTGRFLTRDPIFDGRNWYSYCEGNPIKSIDPNGLSIWGWADDAWVRFSFWAVGRDTTDNNGNPVRIGGYPALFNSNDNAMTYDGTIHVDNEETWNNYRHNQHWQNHEEGHIKQHFKKWNFINYAIMAAFGVVWEFTSVHGEKSKGGPYGHDYNTIEIDAERRAEEKDGIWEFGSPHNPYEW